MKQLVRWGIGLAVLAVLILAAGSSGQDKGKPKFDIKQVMTKAHDGEPPLCRKVVGGSASKDEKELLVELYVALSQNKPKQGDEKGWKEKTDALVSAAKACLADDKDGPDKLKKAVNCKACHEVHKAKK